MTDVLSGLKIYDFIFKGIRDEDAKNGNLFLKRFLDGPQQVWQTIEQKIFDIKTLWDLENVDDKYLVYLQAIVGWVGELTEITEALDFDTLRRLIGTSITLWRDRGPEDTMIGVLRLTTKSQARIWNWFDNRWIVEENFIGEERQDLDSMIVELPSLSVEEHSSDLHIVDDGTLDKTLVVNLVKLMRACGERYLIAYVQFIEMFTADGDYHQWDNIGTAELKVLNTVGTLDNTVVSKEIVVANVTGSSTWSNYLAYFKVKCTAFAASSDLVGGGVYCDSAGLNGYFIMLNIFSNQIQIQKLYNDDWYSMGAGGTVDFSPYGVLKEDVFYGIRVQIYPDGSDTRLKIYIDGEEVANIVDPITIGDKYTQGSIALIRRGDDAIVEFDDIELFELPLETELVGLHCITPPTITEIPIWVQWSPHNGAGSPGVVAAYDWFDALSVGEDIVEADLKAAIEAAQGESISLQWGISAWSGGASTIVIAGDEIAVLEDTRQVPA
jgi:hypothetical protein